MKKPLRFYLAIIMARLTRTLLKLLGRNASHFPGVIGIKICPDFLAYIEKPNRVIAVTGTNGKTTVSNMIAGFLSSDGVDFVNNSLGSNIVPGIAVALLDSTSFLGKNHKELGLFEVDERASTHIFPYLNPEYIIINNLFRDSYRRNAHVDFIADILNQSIPEQSIIITNADDVIASMIAPKNNRFYFSIEPLSIEEEVRDSIIQDLIYCPKCFSKLIYDFQRYHHIGKVHCSNCDFTNKQADLSVTHIDYKKMETLVSDKYGNIYHYPMIGFNITDAYNMLTASLLLLKLGYRHNEIINYFKGTKVIDSRYDEKKFRKHRVVRILAKDQNPVANSRVFDFIRQQSSVWGSISLIFLNEAFAVELEPDEVENTAWLFDADFEYLSDGNVQQIICSGHRSLDYKIRFEMAGFEKEKIICLPPLVNVEDVIDYQVDTIILIHSTKNIEETKTIEKNIVSLIEKREI